MQDSVTQDRERYLGGSDISIIMGISPFKTRWQLLREKAGLEKDTFEGNKYTLYGQEMEGKIRDYVNATLYAFNEDNYFVEGKHTEEGDPIGVRCHTDGENKTRILEIKTTGGNYNLEVYLVQLLFYMMHTNKSHGVLAIYIRPDDMSEEFDSTRLTMMPVDINDYLELVGEINEAVTKFVEDLKAIKDNPFLSEQDLLPSELISISQNVVAFEKRLAEIKKEEKAIKEQKAKLYEAMITKGVKKWVTPLGYKITCVEAIPDSEKEVEEFDGEVFKVEHPRLYKKYMSKKTVKVSGKSGYVRITPPKGEEE